ncbi:uncharacterized protein N7503_009939 [Penicillium pulvis]|uniref:uncharacterized protein n=1 Tax=Penicillium pulvis TaxID=1562058 RepID=UPI0025496A9D|nr:uncharacterized protein N7503_009939 [Penicillium pulvis]KAJ5784727.1 hypothetical protein N7503_009939 [Penicillium pulvis]
MSLGFKPTFSPTFSGKGDESVDNFLLQCKHAWSGTTFHSSHERNEARAAILHLGVTGEAKVFIKSLPELEYYNFEILSSKLKEHFSQRQSMENRGLILGRMMALKQGSKTLEEYADAGREIRNEAPAKDQEILTDRWIAGLADKNLRMNVRLSNYTAKQNDSVNPMHLEQCISAAIYLKGEERYEEPEPSARSQDNRMMEMMEMIQGLQKEIKDMKLQSMEFGEAQMQQNQQLKNPLGIQIHLHRWLDPKDDVIPDSK